MKNLKIWKLYSIWDWKNSEKGKISVYNLVEKYQIAFLCVSTNEHKKVQKGDLFGLFERQTIIAVGEILENPLPITDSSWNFENDMNDFKTDDFYAAKIKFSLLNEDEKFRFPHPKHFCEIQDMEIREKIENFWKNYSEISEDVKELLAQRMENYQTNPQNVVTLEEIVEQFEKKYSYDA